MALIKIKDEQIFKSILDEADRHIEGVQDDIDRHEEERLAQLAIVSKKLIIMLDGRCIYSSQ